VTETTVYLRDGANLTAEKREVLSVKDNKFEPPAGKGAANPTRWKAWPGESMTAAIKVGDVIFSGGAGKVYATGAEDGKPGASAPVPGKVLDLAWDDGRLFVLSEPGTITCFKTGP